MQLIKQKVLSTIRPVFSGLQTPEIVVVTASAIISVAAVIATC